MANLKTQYCRVCRTHGILISKKMGFRYQNGSNQAKCEVCHSQYKLKYSWAYFSSWLDGWKTALLQYSIISFGIAAIPLGIVFFIAYLLRFIFTLNHPYRLVERNEDWKRDA